MSTIRHSDLDLHPAQPLRVRSVVGLAYDEIRSLIVAGALEPGSRLAQGTLADRLGISRGSVREALLRLAGDGLVRFEVNRGFFVAEARLDDVRQRLEVRLALEPEIARLAATRRSETDMELMRDSIAAEASATTSNEVHDASRAFHFAVAQATGNTTFSRLLEGLWIADVGRRLLAQRRRSEEWQDHDVEEHQAILEAFEAGDADRAAELMREHVESAFLHWSPHPNP
ncbi:MAG: GntR family transcriptional regulator [Thermoleophilia bacterium]